MTDLQVILQKLTRIERHLKLSPAKSDWISEEEAMRIAKKSRKTLQVYRNNELSKYRIYKTRSIAGRGIEYSRKEIESLFH